MVAIAPPYGCSYCKANVNHFDVGHPLLVYDFNSFWHHLNLGNGRFSLTEHPVTLDLFETITDQTQQQVIALRARVADPVNHSFEMIRKLVFMSWVEKKPLYATFDISLDVRCGSTGALENAWITFHMVSTAMTVARLAILRAEGDRVALAAQEDLEDQLVPG